MTIKKVNWPALYYYPWKAKAVSILASMTFLNEILSNSRSGAASTMAPSPTTSGTECRRSHVAQSDHCPASPNALHSTCTLTPLHPSGDTGVTKAVSSSGGRQPSYTISCRGRHTKGGRGGTEGGLKVDPEENQDKQRVGVEQNQKLRLPVDSRTYWFCPGTNKKRKFNWSLSLIQSLRSGRSILRKTKTSREATCRKSAQKKHSDKYNLWLDVFDGNSRSILRKTKTNREAACRKSKEKTQRQIQFVIGCVWWKLKGDSQWNINQSKVTCPSFVDNRELCDSA